MTKLHYDINWILYNSKYRLSWIIMKSNMKIHKVKNGQCKGITDNAHARGNEFSQLDSRLYRFYIFQVLQARLAGIHFDGKTVNLSSGPKLRGTTKSWADQPKPMFVCVCFSSTLTSSPWFQFYVWNSRSFDPTKKAWLMHDTWIKK